MLDYDGDACIWLYVIFLFYLYLLGDRIYVGIYLLFSRFPKKYFPNPPNEYFRVINLI